MHQSIRIAQVVCIDFEQGNRFLVASLKIDELISLMREQKGYFYLKFMFFAKIIDFF